MRLKSLKINGCILPEGAENLLDNCSELWDLYVTNEHINLAKHVFPKLERFSFEPRNDVPSGSVFPDFLKLNVNLKNCYLLPNDELIFATVEYTEFRSIGNIWLPKSASYTSDRCGSTKTRATEKIAATVVNGLW